MYGGKIVAVSNLWMKLQEFVFETRPVSNIYYIIYECWNVLRQVGNADKSTVELLYRTFGLEVEHFHLSSQFALLEAVNPSYLSVSYF